MFTTTRTARQTRARIAATTAALGAAALMLTACGGGDDSSGGESDASGEYYYQDGHDYTEGKLVIDGQQAAYYDFDCSDTADKAVLEDEPSLRGEITDDGSEIILASDDEHIAGDATGGTKPFSLSASGDTREVTIGDFDFRTGASEKEELATYDGRCGGDSEETEAVSIPDGDYFGESNPGAYVLSVDGDAANYEKWMCDKPNAPVDTGDGEIDDGGYYDGMTPIEVSDNGDLEFEIEDGLVLSPTDTPDKDMQTFLDKCETF